MKLRHLRSLSFALGFIIMLVSQNIAMAMSQSDIQAILTKSAYYDPNGQCSASATPDTTNSGPGLEEINGFKIPATKGKTGSEDPADATGHLTTNGGAMSFSGALSAIPLDQRQNYVDYYITMRWTAYSWLWTDPKNAEFATVDKAQSKWLSEKPRLVIVTNPRTKKSIIAAALESGPPGDTGVQIGGTPPPEQGWHDPQVGTPATYTGIVSGFPPKAREALGGVHTGYPGEQNPDILEYGWAPNQDATPGPTTVNTPSAATPTTTSSPSQSTSSDSNIQTVWQFLISKGLSPEQTAGFMGNMQAEAHFEPKLVEYGFKNSRGEISVAGQPSSLDDNVPPNQLPNGAPGYGIAQWTSPSRKQGLRDLAAQRGVIGGDLSMQLDYLWKEFSTYHSGAVFNALKSQTTVDGATSVILNQYEMPTERVKNLIKRTGFANQILTKYSGTTTTASGCSGGASQTGVVNCSSAVGNAKLVCAAQQNFGTMYCFTDGHNGHQGNCGHNPKQWLADVAKNGKNSPYYATECSGFVDIAFYLAFGVDFGSYCSSDYPKDSKNFKEIPLDTVAPGDLVIEHIRQGCGTANHVAIVESYDPKTNKLVTLESTAGKNDQGQVLSGRLSYRKLGSDFDGAVRYIGTGSN